MRRNLKHPVNWPANTWNNFIMWLGSIFEKKEIKSLRKVLDEIVSDAFDHGISEIDNVSYLKNRCINIINESCIELTAPIIEKIESFQVEFEDLVENIKRGKDWWHKHYKEQLNPELYGELEKVEAEFGITEEQKKDLDNDNKATKGSIDKEVKRLGYRPIEPGFFDKPWIFPAFIAVLTAVETPLTFVAIENLKITFGPVDTFIYAALFSVLLAISCHIAGEAYNRGEGKMASHSILAGLGLSSLIVALRLMGGEGDFWLQSILAFMNLLFFGLGVLIAYKVNRAKFYWEGKDRVAAISRAKDDLNHKKSRKAPTIKEKKEGFDAMAKMKANEEMENLISEKKKVQSKLKVEKANLKAKKDAFAALEKEYLAAIEDAYLRGKDQ